LARGPHASTAAANIASTSASFDTSAFTPMALRPSAVISATTSFVASSLTIQLTATFAPAFASSTATARPMPEFAPVTRADCPTKLMICPLAPVIWLTSRPRPRPR
jgi:hypothetical protein